MIVDTENTLLYIEPDVKSRVDYNHGVIDNLSKKLYLQLLRYSRNKNPETVVLSSDGTLIKGAKTKGCHVCQCGTMTPTFNFFEGDFAGYLNDGPKSLTYDIVLPCGYVTNSLCLHYLVYHRKAVPQNELAKIRRIADVLYVIDRDQLLEWAKNGYR